MDQTDQPTKVDLSEKIRRTALDALTRRDYAQKELAQKLRLKGYPRDQIDLILAALAQAGLINEHRFTENFIHWRRNRGYGPLRISMELHERGIADEMIAELLQIADNQWFDYARKAWQKQFKGKMPSDFKALAKQIRFLQYRGFTKEQIDSVITQP